MQEMPIWGWLWCGLALAAVIILGLLIKAAQHRLAVANAEAARLPDAIARAERAEKALAELQKTTTEAAAMEASLAAQLSESKKQLEQASSAATRYEDLFLKSEEGGNLLKQQLASSEASLQLTKDQLTLVQGERDAARTQLKDLGAELKQVGEAHAKTLAEKNATQDLLGQSTKFLQDAQTHLKTAFTEAASKVFDEKSIVLDQRIKDSAEVSRKGFEETLKPFAERVGTFQTKIEQFTTDQAKEHATLVGTIGELKTLNQNMADESPRDWWRLQLLRRSSHEEVKQVLT